MLVKERGFRPKQKGVECSEPGCDNWCVSNDLCPKHNMQKYRATAQGKAATKEYNKRFKRPDIKKVCELCHNEFVTARKEQILCGGCSGSPKGNYLAQERYRAKSPEKAKARDVVNKRIKRGVSMFKETCIFCGKDAEMHHEDYSKPLDVTWVCTRHHRLIESFTWNKEVLP